MSTLFQQLVEEVIFEQNSTEQAFKKPGHGTGVLGGLVTDTGKFHDTPKGHHTSQDTSHSWEGRSSDEDITTPRRANNKMGRHTRGNSLRAGKTGKGSKSRTSRKR